MLHIVTISPLSPQNKNEKEMTQLLEAVIKKLRSLENTAGNSDGSSTVVYEMALL